MLNFQDLVAIMGLFLRFNSPGNPILEVLNEVGVFLEKVSPEKMFDPHIIIKNLVGFSISDILLAYNTAAKKEGCRYLYKIKSKNNIFHGFTTTVQQTWGRLQQLNKCEIKLLCDDTGIAILASYSASTGDENKLTDKECGLLCDAINNTHGPNTAVSLVVGNF